MSKSLEKRFWEKVDASGGPDACWEWTGTVHHAGRGVIWVSDNHRAQIASRVAFELLIGKIPEGMLVCHHCDNPLCVNPRHLFLGSPADNSADMVRKGRQCRGQRSHMTQHPERRRGERNPRARLTNTDVLEIRKRFAAGGIPQRELGSEYGVSQNQISRIVLRQAWKHI